MKNNINSYISIIEKDDIIAVADVEELMNIRTGDIDEKINVVFMSKNLVEIGFAKILNRNNHIYIKGDYHGTRLAKKLEKELVVD